MDSIIIHCDAHMLNFKEKPEVAACRPVWRKRTPTKVLFLDTTGRSHMGMRPTFPRIAWHWFTSSFNLNDFLSDGNHLAGPLRMMVSGSTASFLKLTWSAAEIAKNLHRWHVRPLGPRPRADHFTAGASQTELPSFAWGSGQERTVLSPVGRTTSLLGHTPELLRARNWDYSMTFVVCSMVTGDKAPDYDTLIKRDRLRMDNLLKKKKKEFHTNNQMAQKG